MLYLIGRKMWKFDKSQYQHLIVLDQHYFSDLIGPLYVHLVPRYTKFYSASNIF